MGISFAKEGSGRMDFWGRVESENIFEEEVLIYTCSRVIVLPVTSADWRWSH
jgi:hypothetical protein